MKNMIMGAAAITAVSTAAGMVTGGGSKRMRKKISRACKNTSNVIRSVGDMIY